VKMCIEVLSLEDVVTCVVGVSRKSKSWHTFNHSGDGQNTCFAVRNN